MKESQINMTKIIIIKLLFVLTVCINIGNFHVLSANVVVEDAVEMYEFIDSESSKEKLEQSKTIIISVYFNSYDPDENVELKNIENFVKYNLSNISNDYYISQYLPKVHLYVKRTDDISNQLNILDSQTDVSKIVISEYIYYYNEVDEYFDDGIGFGDGGGSNIDPCTENQSISGDVKIGIVDSGNINRNYSDETCDVNVFEQFPDAQDSDHVTSIVDMIANEFADINKLTIYSSVSFTQDIYDILPAIEYLIANDVDVITLSIGTGSIDTVGVYHSTAQDIDELILNEGIPIIAAAGQNNGDKEWSEGSEPTKYYVVSPAIGYNVVGVGGIMDLTNELMPGSSYEIKSSSDLVISKPNIVANPEYLTFTGTSISAPRVATKVANLIYNNPTKSYSANYIMALLHISANENVGSFIDGGTGFDAKLGAGKYSDDFYVFDGLTTVIERENCIKSQLCITENISSTSSQYVEVAFNYLVNPDEFNFVGLNTYKVKVTINNHTDIYYLDSNSLIIRVPEEVTEFSITLEWVSGNYTQNSNGLPWIYQNDVDLDIIMLITKY